MQHLAPIHLEIDSRPPLFDEQMLADIRHLLECAAMRDVCAGSVSEDRHSIFCDSILAYVLKILGVPSDGSEKIGSDGSSQGSWMGRFSREWFELLFYSSYLDKKLLTATAVLSLMRAERESNLDSHYLSVGQWPPASERRRHH